MPIRNRAGHRACIECNLQQMPNTRRVLFRYIESVTCSSYGTASLASREENSNEKRRIIYRRGRGWRGARHRCAGACVDRRRHRHSGRTGLSGLRGAAGLLRTAAPRLLFAASTARRLRAACLLRTAACGRRRLLRRLLRPAVLASWLLRSSVLAPLVID